MSKLKRFLAAFLSLVMLFVLTGCGNGVDVFSFRNTLAAVNALKSFSYKADADVTYTTYGLEGEIKANAEGDVMVDPLTLSAEAELDMGDFGALSFPMYIGTEDNQRTFYLGVDLGGSVIWRSVKLGSSDENLTPDVKTLLTIYLCLADTVTCAGEEKVNSASATRYDFTITREDIATLITELKLEDTIREEYPDFDVVAMAKALDDVSGSFWISDEDDLPLRLEIELNSFAQSIIDSTLSDMGGVADIDIESLLLNIYFDNFDGVKSIKIPEEVIKSAE